MISEGHGFFDTASPAAGRAPARRPDRTPQAAAGLAHARPAIPTAAALLLRLEALNERADYAEMARQTLETFAGVVEHFGLYAASYALALQRLLREPVQVCIIGEDDAAVDMEAAALRRFAVNKSVVRLKRVQLGTQPSDMLPPALQETLPRLPEHWKAASQWSAAATPVILP